MPSHGGLTWAAACEVGVNGGDGFYGIDPVVFFSTDGTAVVVTQRTVLTSTDSGCTWRTTFAPSAQQLVDAAVDPTIAGTSGWYVVGQGSASNIYHTADGGKTYTTLLVSPSNLSFTALGISPALPGSLVASAIDAQTHAGPYILRSTDGGQNWTAPVLMPGGPAQVSSMRIGMNPLDNNSFWVAVSDLATSGTAVLRTSDGGSTGVAVATSSESFRHFSIAEDLSTIYFATSHHIWRSDDSGASFAPLVSPRGNACVAIGQNGLLYGCGNTAIDGFALGISRDRGDTWVTQFSMNQVQGVLSCPASSPVASACGNWWPGEASILGAAIGGNPGGKVTLDGTDTLNMVWVASQRASQAMAQASVPCAKKGDVPPILHKVV